MQSYGIRELNNISIIILLWHCIIIIIGLISGVLFYSLVSKQHTFISVYLTTTSYYVNIIILINMAFIKFFVAMAFIKFFVQIFCSIKFFVAMFCSNSDFRLLQSLILNNSFSLCFPLLNFHLFEYEISKSLLSRWKNTLPKKIRGARKETKKKTVWDSYAWS